MQIIVKKSFYILLAISMIFGFMVEFFLFTFAVFLHEISHLIFGFIFGRKSKKIIISLFETNVIFDKINSLALYKKIIITIAGIITNFCMYLSLSIFKVDTYYLVIFKNINLILTVVNILPIYPLDCGRLFLYLFSDKFGQLKVSYFLVFVSKVFSVVIILLGFIVLLLFPFNIFLYIVGIYLYRYNNEKSEKQLYLEFYLSIINGNKDYDKVLVGKNIFVSINTKLKLILNNVSMNTYLTITVDNEGAYIVVKEKDFINYIINNGIIGTAKCLI